MNYIFQLFKEIGLSDFVDILLVSLLIYALILWFQQKRAVFVLSGIIICGVIYLLAHQFSLLLLQSVLQGFFAVILIAIIVIFQEELRYFFEQIAVWSFERKKLGKQINWKSRKDIQIIIDTLIELAHEKVGAIIVLKGTNVLVRHIHGGIDLDGDLSKAILKSIFDPHSMGHDGAVIVENGRIQKFGVHLPLSHNLHNLLFTGTRHAAALGLAELTDALCLIVSEERGVISLAQNGRLVQIAKPDHLFDILTNFYNKVDPVKKKENFLHFFKKNYRQKVFAFMMALVLWFVLVHETTLVYQSFSIPVSYPAPPYPFVVKTVQPQKVEATFYGPRNSFHFLNEKDIHLSVGIVGHEESDKTYMIREGSFSFPEQFKLESFDPRRVRVVVEKIIEDQENL